LGRKNDISMGVFEIHMLRQIGIPVFAPVVILMDALNTPKER